MDADKPFFVVEYEICLRKRGCAISFGKCVREVEIRLLRLARVV